MLLCFSLSRAPLDTSGHLYEMPDFLWGAWPASINGEIELLCLVYQGWPVLSVGSGGLPATPFHVRLGGVCYLPDVPAHGT